MARYLLSSLRMGRALRIQIPGLHYHIIVRCNNEEFHFENEEDFSIYLHTLHFVQKKHQFKLFNYELMNSHVHLFLEPSKKIPLSKTLLLINWTFARNYNRRKKRKGHFWLDRYKSIPVEADQYALAIMRYMNRNPIRAGMIEKLGEWKWSGYRFYAFGETNELLEAHPSYLALSSDKKKRQEEYQIFVNSLLPFEDQGKIKWSRTSFIGSEDFILRLQN